MIKDVMSKRGRFAALTQDHPGVGNACPGCWETLKAGDRPALVNSEEVAGEETIVMCVMAHERCAFPDEEPLTSPEPFQLGT